MIQGAQALIIFANSAKVYQDVKDKTSVKHVIVTQIGDFLSFQKTILINFVLKHVKKAVPDYDLPDALSLTDILANSDYEKFNKLDVTHDDIAFLQYTGGTTGVSKGAVLTHKTLFQTFFRQEHGLEILFKREKK